MTEYEKDDIFAPCKSSGVTPFLQTPEDVQSDVWPIFGNSSFGATAPRCPPWGTGHADPLEHLVTTPSNRVER